MDLKQGLGVVVALLHVLVWSVVAHDRSLLAAGLRSSGLPRGLLQSSTCRNVSRCGPSCIPCTFKPANGNPACTLNQEGVFECNYSCNRGFVKAIVDNKAGCKRVTRPPKPQKRTTGLLYTPKNLGASEDRQPRAQRKRYTGLRDRAKNTRNVGASTPEALTRAACNGENNCSDYEDVLLLTLMPAAYSSNNTADTGGYAFISPAQDQGDCNACVGFVATAAAEAAVNVYMKQNWDKLGLSEQDISFCRFSPKINCATGSSYDDLIKNVEKSADPSSQQKTLQQWASRDCYPYVARAELVCRESCPSQLPQGGAFSMAYEGNALPSVATIKEQILLNGGVMTSIAVLPDFLAYKPTPSRDVYNSNVQTITNPNLHAVFCYGWNDTGEWFVCKNSWGTSWGLQGSFKITYGAVFVMQPDYTFALQFGPKVNRTTQLSMLLSKFTGKTTSDPANASCILYTPENPMHLAHLQRDLVFLAAASPSFSVSRVDILQDLVLSNVGQLSDLVGLINSPVRVCGMTDELYQTSDYVGCFIEPTCGSQRERAMVFLIEDSRMTVKWCKRYAAAAGYAYAAVQSRKECYGGNDISRYTVRGRCDTPCDGNPAQMCGGSCTNAIYAVTGTEAITFKESFLTQVAGGTNFGEEYTRTCPKGSFVTEFKGGIAPIQVVNASGSPEPWGDAVEHIIIVCSNGEELSRVGSADRTSTTFSMRFLDGFAGLNVRAGNWLDAVSTISLSGEVSQMYGKLDGGSAIRLVCPIGERAIGITGKASIILVSVGVLCGKI